MKFYLQIIFIAIFILISSCASNRPAQSTSELKAIASEAMTQQMQCAFEKIAKIDDGISDAQSIAIALASACRREYYYAIETYADVTLSNANQKRMFMKRMGSLESKIEGFLPIVLEYRASLKNKAASKPKN